MYYTENTVPKTYNRKRLKKNMMEIVKNEEKKTEINQFQKNVRKICFTAC